MDLSKKTNEDLDRAIEINSLKKIEAALFISGRYLSLQELVALTDVNPIMLKEIISKLEDKYSDDSGIEIVRKDNSWKMDVKQEHMEMVNRLATGSAEFTRAEQETLAIIAYKQPVKQSVIIKIRGNKAYEHVKNFAELGLIRAKKAGRTKELSLSENFYDYFAVGNQKNSGKSESFLDAQKYEHQ
ncbi:MAG: SMC-Scp complex subunit ScpB [archaeon]